MKKYTFILAAALTVQLAANAQPQLQAVKNLMASRLPKAPTATSTENQLDYVSVSRPDGRQVSKAVFTYNDAGQVASAVEYTYSGNPQQARPSAMTTYGYGDFGQCRVEHYLYENGGFVLDKRVEVTEFDMSTGHPRTVVTSVRVDGRLQPQMRQEALSYVREGVECYTIDYMADSQWVRRGMEKLEYNSDGTTATDIIGMELDGTNIEITLNYEYDAHGNMTKDSEQMTVNNADYISIETDYANSYDTLDRLAQVAITPDYDSPTIATYHYAEQTVTGMGGVPSQNVNAAGSWYDLGGRRADAANRPGLWVHDGRKVMRGK